MTRAIRRLAAPALGLVLLMGCAATPASGQEKKEVTDGFFDIPVDPNAEPKADYGVPAYLVTSGLGGAAIFILCKSARRQ